MGIQHNNTGEFFYDHRRKQTIGGVALGLVALMLAVSAACSAEALPKDRVFRVGYMCLPHFQEMYPNGRKSGYSFEYLQKLAIYTGWKYQYVGYEDSWARQLERVQNGEVDFLTCGAKTPEREKLFDFSTRPVGYEMTRVCLKKGSPFLGQPDMKHWQQAVVGVEADSVQASRLEDYLRANAITQWVKRVYATIPELNRALHAGEINVIWMSNLHNINDTDVEVYAELDSQPYYFLFKKGNDELKSQVDDAMSQLDIAYPSHRTDLQHKYFSIQSGEPVIFSARENLFIAEANDRGRVFTAMLNPDRKPFSYVEKEVFKGVFKDVADLVFKRCGLKVKWLVPGNRKTYREMLFSKEIDILPSCRYDYNAVADSGYVLTEPYLSLNISILRRNNQTGAPIRRLADLDNASFRPGLSESSTTNFECVIFEKTDDAVRSVLSGQCDALYLYTDIAEMYLRNDPRRQLMAELVNGIKVDFSFAVRLAGNEGLATVIAKVVASISDEDIRTIYNQNVITGYAAPTFWDYFYLYPWLMSTLIGVCAVIALGVLTLFLISKRRSFAELDRAQKQTLQLLDEQTAMLRSIGDGVIVTDAQGRIAMMNPVAERLIQCSSQEAVGKRHEEVFSVKNYQNGEVLESPLREAIRMNRIVLSSDRTELTTHTGRHFTVSMSASPIHTSDQVTGAILVFRDVTEDFRQRDELRTALLMLEYASQLSKTASFRLNPKTMEITGSRLLDDFWPIENGIAVSHEKWIYHEDRDNFRTAYQRLLAGHSHSEIGIEYRSTHHGDLRYYRIRAGLDHSNPDQTMVVGVVQDVTRENELFQNEQVVNTCLETIFNDENSTQSLQEVLRLVTHHMQATHCYILKSDMQTCTAEMRAEWHEPDYESFFVPGQVLSFKPDNTAIQAMLRHEVIVQKNLGANQAPVGIAAWNEIFKDRPICSLYLAGIYVQDMLWGNITLVYEDRTSATFTERNLKFLRSVSHMIELLLVRRRNHEILASAISQAQAADRAKSYFLASMSHEIRTPLNSVIGFSELLRDTQLPVEQQRDYLNSIATAGQALLALINDVLDLSKLEAGQMVFTPVEVDFNALVREVGELFHQLCAAKGVEIIYDMLELPNVFVDKLRLRQILLNIIGNAQKFTSQGSITVRVRFSRDKWKAASAVPVNPTGMLIFSVVDTGCGIPKEDQKALFEPFVQAKSMRGTRAANNGTGLGLTIVAKMLERMNGSIALTSEVGVGSDFTVTLRNVRYVERPVNAPRESSISSGNVFRLPPGGLRVLLVDDVPMNIKVLSAQLSKTGVSVIAASNGREALERLAGETVDAVLTDLWMPGMNGAELATAIRNRHEWAKMPIIAVTADVESHNDFDMSVFTQFLVKPITIEKLEQLLSMLGKKKEQGISK